MIVGRVRGVAVDAFDERPHVVFVIVRAGVALFVHSMGGQPRFLLVEKFDFLR